MSAENCSNEAILYEATIHKIEQFLCSTNPGEQLTNPIIDTYIHSFETAINVLKTAAHEYYKELKGQSLAEKINRTDNCLSSARHRIVDLMCILSENPASITDNMLRPELPEIVIPEFDGDIEKWPSFWSLFKFIIHDRKDINDVIKFCMLKQHLKGMALRTVEGLTTRDYSEAIKLLESHFSDDRKLDKILRLRMFKLPHPKHNAIQLTNFLLEWNKISYRLEALSGQKDMGPYVKEIVLGCLSEETLRNLYHKYNSYDLTAAQIKEGIEELIQDLIEGPVGNDVAMKVPESRLSNDKKLEQNLRRQMFKLPHPKHNPRQLRNFLLKWNTISYQLEALTGEKDTDPYVREIVLGCLSTKTLRNLYYKYKSCDLTVDQIKEGIVKIVEILEYTT